MEDISYLDLDLLIERAGRKYRARVIGSPVGPTSSIEFPAPITKLALENFLLKIGRPRQTVRRIDSPPVDEIKRLGGRLYGAVFRDQLRDCLKASEQEARRQELGLRIRLHLDAPALADLPWEYMYNEAAGSFLSLSRGTPIVRFVEIDDVPSPLRLSPPLRALTVIANPSDYAQLDAEGEWRRLTEALSDQVSSRALELQRLEPATVDELQRTLQRNTFHILHYIGHGGFSQSTDEGVLLLENEYGESQQLSGEDLGILLQDHPSLRLVVLNSCEGARGSLKDPFSGTAQSLMRRRIPAVIAMQFEITDTAALKFSQAFYSALATSYPVDAALAEARKSIRLSGNEVEWGTPVLYMLAPDGHIFELPRNEQEEQERKAREEQEPKDVSALADPPDVIDVVRSTNQRLSVTAETPSDPQQYIYAKAAEYERVRLEMPPGDRRSDEMSLIADEVREAMQGNSLSADGMRNLFQNSEGGRMVALAILGANPDPELVDLVRDGIANNRSAFEQYQALRAAESLAPFLPEAYRRLLADVIRSDMGDGRRADGRRQFIRQGTDRWFIAERVLRLLEQEPKAEEELEQKTREQNPRETPAPSLSPRVRGEQERQAREEGPRGGQDAREQVTVEADSKKPSEVSKVEANVESVSGAIPLVSSVDEYLEGVKDRLARSGFQLSTDVEYKGQVFPLVARKTQTAREFFDDSGKKEDQFKATYFLPARLLAPSREDLKAYFRRCFEYVKAEKARTSDKSETFYVSLVVGDGVLSDPKMAEWIRDEANAPGWSVFGRGCVVDLATGEVEMRHHIVKSNQ